MFEYALNILHLVKFNMILKNIFLFFSEWLSNKLRNFINCCSRVSFYVLIPKNPHIFYDPHFEFSFLECVQGGCAMILSSISRSRVKLIFRYVGVVVRETFKSLKWPIFSMYMYLPYCSL